MVAAGLSFQAALAAGFFGTIVALVFYLIMATLGVDYGIPGQVATRVRFELAVFRHCSFQAAYVDFVRKASAKIVTNGNS
jgi:hypothetical protein